MNLHGLFDLNKPAQRFGVIRLASACIEKASTKITNTRSSSGFTSKLVLLSSTVVPVAACHFAMSAAVMSRTPQASPAHRIANRGFGACNDPAAVAGFMSFSGRIIFELIGFRARNPDISSFPNLGASYFLAARSPRVGHNRDCALDRRPRTSSTRSSAIDWKWVACRRNSTGSILPRTILVDVCHDAPCSPLRRASGPRTILIKIAAETQAWWLPSAKFLSQPRTSSCCRPNREQGPQTSNLVGPTEQSHVGPNGELSVKVTR
jgi:hypothetical protein